MQQVRFSVPLYLTTGKRKPKNNWLNMNNFRNWQFHLSNDLKILFNKAITIPELDAPLAACKITFVFYYPTHQRRDLDNSLSVIAKFTQDSLVAAKVILDDDYKIVRQITGKYGGLDKTNPRCEVIVEEVDAS